MMKLTANISAATITARGITASRAAILGVSPNSRKSPPTASATLRLPTPVAAATPTDCDEVVVPIEPIAPAIIVETPSARTPRTPERISGRTHSASFIFWHIVMVPSPFMAAAIAAMANGSARLPSNESATCEKLGNPIHRAFARAPTSAAENRPAARAAM
jgi:hypothetical protein